MKKVKTTTKRRTHIKKRRNGPKIKQILQPSPSKNGYEYIVEDFSTATTTQDLEAKLNELGEENWYLIGVGYWNAGILRFCFVRDSVFTKE